MKTFPTKSGLVVAVSSAKSTNPAQGIGKGVPAQFAVKPDGVGDPILENLHATAGTAGDQAETEAWFKFFESVNA